MVSNYMEVGVAIVSKLLGPEKYRRRDIYKR